MPAIRHTITSMVVLMRASLFTGGALISLLVVQALGFDISGAADLGRLKSPLVMLMALMFSIGITGVLGAAIGFRLLPLSAVVSTTQVLALGSSFGLLAFVGFVPSLQTLGVVAGAVLYVVAAGAMAFVGGHMLSRLR